MTASVDATPITEGYEAVRNGRALVEIDHSYLEISGPGARDLIDRQVSRGIGFLLEGQVLAVLVLDECRILAECAVYRTSDGYLLEVRSDVAEAVAERLGDRDDVVVADRPDLVSIGVEGPYSWQIVADMIDFPISAMAYQSFADATWNRHSLLMARTGITGEYGYRLIVDTDVATELRDHLIGLGCATTEPGDLDVLRCEMRFPLLGAGTGLEEYTPLELGVQWMVDFEHDFAGLSSLVDSDWSRRAVCWMADAGPAAVAVGDAVVIGDEGVGAITEAQYSPRLGGLIGTAVISADLAAAGIDYRTGDTTITSISAPFMVTKSFGVPVQ